MNQDGLESSEILVLSKPVPVPDFLMPKQLQIDQEEAVVADCRQTSPAESAAWDCHPPRAPEVEELAVSDCHPSEVRLQDFARQQNYLDYSYLRQLQKRPVLPL
jgi:hypothetical protein